MAETPRVGDHLHPAKQSREAIGGLTGSSRLRDALAAMYRTGSDATDAHDRGLSHDANFPTWSAFPAGSGADSTWGYEGAWMYVNVSTDVRATRPAVGTTDDGAVVVGTTGAAGQTSRRVARVAR